MTQKEFNQYRENFLQNENGISTIQLFNGLMDFGTRLIHRYDISYDEERDLLQNSLIVAFKNMAFYKEEYQFTTWFGTILKNKAIDYLRKKNSLKFKNVRSIDSFIVSDKNECSIINVVDKNSCPVEKINASEIYSQMEKCISLVKNEKKRIILEMYFLEGKSNSEIIITLQAKKQMVNVTIHRFRENMKSQFINKLNK